MAKTKTASLRSQLQINSQRATQLSFVFIGIYAVSILIFTAWKLITPESLADRWTVFFVALAANTTLWFFSRRKNLNDLYYQGIISLLICVYIGVATYSIYAERGMASNAIILYAIPLAIASLTYRARALFATAALSSLTYSTAAIIYFRHYPSEGYKVELYGQLVFYSAILFLLAALLWTVVRSRRATR